MKFTSALVAVAGLLSATSALAAPEVGMAKVVKRADGTPTDVEILNYALTLEFLERRFYADVVAKFDAAAFKKAGYPATVYSRLTLLAKQEAEHVAFLAGALGTAGVGECKYAFGLTTPKAALATARLLENVGVAAYLGAAGDISTPAYLAAAASILTVEARHASYLNEENNVPGFPATYDSGYVVRVFALFFLFYTLASPLIVPGSCGAGALPASIQAFPAVTVTTKTARSGHRANISFPLKAGYTGSYYAAFITSGATTFAPVQFGPDSKVTVSVPKGLSGLTYILISTSATLADNEHTAAFGTIFLDRSPRLSAPSPLSVLEPPPPLSPSAFHDFNALPVLR
uniref:Ferritin-like domain-containing protein n=1 Tax=Rhodosporidiobolus colostri TaxID=255053 RepID=A0A9E9GFS6_9BASI|nr:hypothetical protein [Rhodosporidiobolus colostri]